MVNTNPTIFSLWDVGLPGSGVERLELVAEMELEKCFKPMWQTSVFRQRLRVVISMSNR